MPQATERPSELPPSKLPDKAELLTMLKAWVDQKPGLDPRDYNDLTAYRSDARRITRQRSDFQRLLGDVVWDDAIEAKDLVKAFEGAFSGRLSLTQEPQSSWRLTYCTGQYWPMEFRAAACAVLASALWGAERAKLDPEADKPGDVLRNGFKKTFGSGIASRWLGSSSTGNPKLPSAPPNQRGSSPCQDSAS